MLDHDAIAVGQDDMVGIEPFKVLDWLLTVLQEELWYVHFLGVPHLQVGHGVLWQHDRAELVVSTRDPSCLLKMIVLADMEDLEPRVDIVAED